MNRAVVLVVAAGLGLGLSSCGQSVAKGGENAATHPASGYVVSPTTGAGSNSGPTVPVATPSTSVRLSSQVTSTVAGIEKAVPGGCWQDAGIGNVYGAVDQYFWYPVACGAQIAQIVVEVYPDASKARKAESHPIPTSPATFYAGGANLVSLAARYRTGALLVDVYDTAPAAAQAGLSSLSGLHPVRS